VLAASRRIYIFPQVSDWLIGNDVSRVRWLALTFVGSGFKTLAFMLLLTFWSITLIVLTGAYDAIHNLFATGSEGL